MSRTKRSIRSIPGVRAGDGRDKESLIPRKLKKVWRSRDKARDRQALREGKDPAPAKRTDRWNFL